MKEKQPWPYDQLPYEVILSIIEQTDTFINTTNPRTILSKEQRARVQDLPTFIFRFAARMALHKKLGTLFNMAFFSKQYHLPIPTKLHQSTFITALVLLKKKLKIFKTYIQRFATSTHL